MAKAFNILVETPTDTFKAFTWRKDADSGIAEAKRQCEERGVAWLTIYACPTKP